MESINIFSRAVVEETSNGFTNVSILNGLFTLTFKALADIHSRTGFFYTPIDTPLLTSQYDISCLSSDNKLSLTNESITLNSYLVT
jgi:hypothetical protein